MLKFALIGLVLLHSSKKAASRPDILDLFFDSDSESDSDSDADSDVDFGSDSESGSESDEHINTTREFFGEIFSRQIFVQYLKLFVDLQLQYIYNIPRMKETELRLKTL